MASSIPKNPLLQTGSSALYSVFDLKAGCFSPPFIARSDDDAKRMFHHMLNSSKDTIVMLYPSDFILYFLCNWSGTTGVEFGETDKRPICSAFDLSGKVKDTSA